jgi:hypothetical protein
MSPGAKIFLTLAGAAGVIGIIAIAAAPAHAQPAPPKQKPGSNAPPDVIVPPPGTLPGGQPATPPAPPSGGQPPSSPPLFPPLPSLPLPGGPITPPAAQPPFPSSALPQVPPGVTVSLPNPLGGPPLGTFDPATGNVFGPNGVIIGTFNPGTGVFTASNGMTFQIPGFPAGGQQQPIVPASTPPSVAPLPPLQPGPAAPPPAAPPVSAPVTTVQGDTAAMVSTLLNAEANAGWNVTDPNVKVFQANRGLKQDAKFGPTTALKAALEIGTLPLIRFWPLGSSKATLLQNYQAALLELANKSADPAHAAQLRHSAQREQAQAFSVKGKIAAVPASNQVQIAQVA